METNAETGVVAALRREPEQAILLLKLSLVVALGIVAWDLLAPMAVPAAAVTVIIVVVLLLYGATMTYLVGRLMSATDAWASRSKAAVTRLSPDGGRGKSARSVDIDTLGSAPDQPKELTPDEDRHTEPAPEPKPVESQDAFNEAYFLLRLQEQVKDARRDGSELSVAAIHITLPGRDMTLEAAERVAFDMARLASGQARVMSPPLALEDCEFLFSLVKTGSDDTRQFVREIVRAFGDYWCHFGISTFPHSGTNADTLIEKARAACDASIESGKRSQVEYASA